MPYLKPFALVTFGFGVGGTDEIAQTSLHVCTLGGGAFDADGWVLGFDQADADACLQAYNTMIDDAGGAPYWGDYSDLITLRVAAFDTAGDLSSAPKVFAITTPRSGSSRDVPPQCSTVLTFWSGLTFGQANYGRMYLPHTFVAMDAGDPYTGVSLCNTLVGAAALFVGTVNGVASAITAGAGVDLVSPQGSGSVKAVAYVRIGNVTDTQRRRRNALNEKYSQATV